MTTTAYRDADGWVCFVQNGESTWLPSEHGDTPAHAQLAAWIEAGGEIADQAPPAPPRIGAALAAYKVEVAAAVDRAAEAERLKYVTDGAGQAMTYAEKAAQARAALAATDPQPEEYALLAAEIGVTGDSLIEVATVVNTAYQQWLVIGGQIERVRLSAKAAVTASETEAQVHIALSAIVWPGQQN